MNLYAGLLFQSGHIADPKLALSLASDDRSVPAQVASPTPVAQPGGLRWLIEELVLLGGRPVSRDHLDDLDEPFPPLHGCH